MTATATTATLTLLATDGTTSTMQVPLPIGPADYPIYPYAQLYKSGDSFPDVLRNRIPVPRAYVTLPSGFEGELVDFTDVNHYSLYAPRCMGLWGPSSNPTDARVRLRPNSSTQVALVPKQASKAVNPLMLARFGPANNSTPVATHHRGWSLIGTPQAVDPNTGQPHTYGGLVDYMNVGATYTDMLFQGIPASWNSPPGETAQWTSYRTRGTRLTRVEVNGFDEAGNQVGGGTGGSAMSASVWSDCYLHDSFVSGFSFSFAGSSGAGNECDVLETYRCTVARNANHSTADGRTFAGVNHEAVTTRIYHEDLTVSMTVGNTREHVGLRNGYADCPDVQINGITWDNSPSFAGKLLVVAVPHAYAGAADGVNRQTTLPTIRAVKNGPVLTPVTTSNGADPTKNYLLIR